MSVPVRFADIREVWRIDAFRRKLRREQRAEAVRRPWNWILRHVDWTRIVWIYTLLLPPYLLRWIWFAPERNVPAVFFIVVAIFAFGAFVAFVELLDPGEFEILTMPSLTNLLWARWISPFGVAASFGMWCGVFQFLASGAYGMTPFGRLSLALATMTLPIRLVLYASLLSIIGRIPPVLRYANRSRINRRRRFLTIVGWECCLFFYILPLRTLGQHFSSQNAILFGVVSLAYTVLLCYWLVEFMPLQEAGLTLRGATADGAAGPRNQSSEATDQPVQSWRPPDWLHGWGRSVLYAALSSLYFKLRQQLSPPIAKLLFGLRASLVWLLAAGTSMMYVIGEESGMWSFLLIMTYGTAMLSTLPTIGRVDRPTGLDEQLHLLGIEYRQHHLFWLRYNLLVQWLPLSIIVWAVMLANGGDAHIATAALISAVGLLAMATPGPWMLALYLPIAFLAVLTMAILPPLTSGQMFLAADMVFVTALLAIGYQVFFVTEQQLRRRERAARGGPGLLRRLFFRTASNSIATNREASQ